MNRRRMLLAAIAVSGSGLAVGSVVYEEELETAIDDVSRAWRGCHSEEKLGYGLEGYGEFGYGC